MIERRTTPTRRKQCPVCKRRSYFISRTYAYEAKYEVGKKKFSGMRSMDAGSFTCMKCGFRETF